MLERNYLVTAEVDRLLATCGPRSLQCVHRQRVESASTRTASPRRPDRPDRPDPPTAARGSCLNVVRIIISVSVR